VQCLLVSYRTYTASHNHRQPIISWITRSKWWWWWWLSICIAHYAKNELTNWLRKSKCHCTISWNAKLIHLIEIVLFSSKRGSLWNSRLLCCKESWILDNRVSQKQLKVTIVCVLCQSTFPVFLTLIYSIIHPLCCAGTPLSLYVSVNCLCGWHWCSAVWLQLERISVHFVSS